MPTYPLTPPARPGLVEIRWNPDSVVAVQKSPFTLDEKVYVWDGQQMSFTASLPPMSLEDAKKWKAFILSLNGREGTFYWRDSVAGEKGGTAAGDVRVNGGSQTGNEIEVDGLLPNHVRALVAGDWVSIEDRLYTVLEDVASDASGLATITVWPSIRTAPADDAVVSVGPDARGIFRLLSWPDFGWPVSRLMEGFKISACEAA